MALMKISSFSWHRRTFSRWDRVLVIKLVAGGATEWAQRALHDAIEGAGNIRLVEGMLPEADMLGLMAASDVVISLHRSEGFGLGPSGHGARETRDRHRLDGESRIHDRAQLGAGRLFSHPGGAIAAADVATKLSPKTFAATISRLLSEGENRGHNAAGHH